MKRKLKVIQPLCFYYILSCLLLTVNAQYIQNQSEEYNQIVKKFDEYLEAAKQGDPSAQFKVGLVHLQGSPEIPSNREEAASWFQKSADNNNNWAQFYLGLHYEPVDNLKASILMDTAASNSDTKDLIQMYEVCNFYGSSFYKYFAHIAALRGDVNAILDLSLGYEFDKNFKEAAFWYQKAANAQNPSAMFSLAWLYQNGEGIPIDNEKAFYWYSKAADLGNIDAQLSLAVCYKLGVGTPIDIKKSDKWYKKAASNTGTYKFLEIVEQFDFLGHYDESFFWKKRAASQGIAKAQFNLAEAYEKGLGVEKNLQQSIFWYRKAAEQGEENAIARLSALENKKSDRPRYALLIANSNYSNFGGGLANAIPDADKLHEVLDALGFEITLIKNADHEGMEAAIDDFKERIRGTNAITLFHYGGHGVQVDGKNYLIPADADIPDERLVKHRAVDLDEVIGALETAEPSASVILIDACRDNPLPAVATRSTTRGLAVVGRKPKNSVIIFAAEPGGRAKDGLFTPILADTIAQNPNLSVGQIMLKVRAKVIDQSDGSQTPGEYSQLVEEVFLKPKP